MVDSQGEILKLREGHTWKCQPGYKIFVLGQGELRFDVPEDWFMEVGENSVRFYDRKPPDDNCRLEVSRFRHSRINWSGLPLDQLVRNVWKDMTNQDRRMEDLHRQSRPGIELVWAENVFIDPNEKKPARSRIAIVRGLNAHALVTLDYWEDDAARVLPAWDEAMRSFDMDLKVKDPTIGEQKI